MKDFLGRNWATILYLLIFAGCGAANVILYKRYLNKLNSIEGYTSTVEDVNKKEKYAEFFRKVLSGEEESE